MVWQGSGRILVSTVGNYSGCRVQALCGFWMHRVSEALAGFPL